MQRKVGQINVRLDADLMDFVKVLKSRPGGLSRFICDALRAEMQKTAK